MKDIKLRVTYKKENCCNEYWALMVYVVQKKWLCFWVNAFNETFLTKDEAIKHMEKYCEYVYNAKKKDRDEINHIKYEKKQRVYKTYTCR